MMNLASHDLSSDMREHPTLLPDDVFLLPTSFAQQRLWFIDQFESGSPFYNISGAFQVEGSLNSSALNYALNSVVARHEILRTIFPNVDGEPMQAIFFDTLSLNAGVIDLELVGEENRQELALSIAREVSRCPFNLMSWPLLRVTLIRLNAQNHILLISVHHIVSDGWSMGVMIREVSECYSRYERGEESGLAELEIQYGDYAAWQRENVSAERESEELEYWARQLDEQENMELATDRGRPAVQSYRGGREPVEVSQEITAGLKRLSRQAGATLFMTLLSALRVVLWKNGGQKRSIVGTPVAGRNRREVEGLIGLFVNTLALGGEVSEDREFIEQLRREREVCLGGYAHQEVAFHKVVERVQPERSLSHTPIFQVMLALQNTPAAPLNFSNIILRPVDLDNGFTLVDLALLLTEEQGRITGSIRYSTDIYNEDTIRRLISQYLQILSEVAEEPARPLWQLGRVNQPDRHLILRQFNDTSSSFPRELNVCDLFEERVRAQPAAVALVSGEEHLTYEQLNRRANKLARHLIARGVEAERVVGISLERGVEMIVGLLAILKAGGAYLPLDPSYPSARLRHMVENARVGVVISRGRYREILEKTGTAGVELMMIDEDRHQIDSESGEDVPRRVGPDNLAYIIYTSGSTGTPKGVMIQHASLGNLVNWHIHKYEVTDSDVASLVARQGFDASVWELWPYLCAGARLEVSDEEMSRSGLGLGEWITRQGVTISFMATPLAEALMGDEQLAASRLRYLLTGGEQLKNYAPADANYKVVNHYGPTESTVVTSSGEVGEREEGSRGPLIGKPISNTRVYIVDERQDVVGIGVEGELLVAGEGLARGYVGEAGLTAERFIPDPFSQTPGERMYRTGDICRWTSGGDLEFIGRRDNQVKIRGYRVELGEIEAAAVREEWVEQAAVVAVDVAQRGKQIVGFYAERQPQADGEEVGTNERERELSRKLGERMPEYMRAARWERVEGLPLTVNGKVDRRELEQRATKLMQEGRERDAAAEKRRAATAIEEIVAGIWEEVLGVSEVGVEDNFFEIGGHSLLATQMVTRIREALGVDVGVREVFEGATVREICRKLEERLSQEGRYERKQITRVSRDNPLPLSFAQERFRFLEMFQPGTSVYHMPVAVRLTGNLNVPALEKSLNEVRRRHEVLRTRFVDEGGEGVQIIDQAQDESLSVCDLEQVADDQRDDEVKKLIRQEADRAFDLAQGRLMRNSLLRVSSIEHVLVVVVHHIISDGWSMGVMIKEVSECYSRYERGEESGLAELEIQYGDYAAWQRENVSAERESEELEYWARQLDGQENVELATDRVRPAVQSFSGGRERMEVREEITAGLKRLSRQGGATLFMTLLAAFKILLYRYSDHEDITVGTLIAGRNRIETEGLIGLFINAIALRTDLSGNPTFAELLKRVREGTLAAYAHQDLPFEKLVDHLHVERDMSRSPLFQIMFLFQNAPLSPLELPGITLTPLEYYSGAVAYDLMISISEQGRGLNIKLEYSKDLFNDETIRQMLKHYGALLESIVAAPAGHISDLPLLEELERKQLLLDWNDAVCPYPLHESFTRLFEIQVESTPDSIAVAGEGRSLTYRELDQQANKLAGLLVNFGVEAESIVALYARRSMEFLTAILAVFKAGGTYLPLDPAYPVNRISTTIEQAQCVAVLASVEFQENLMRALGTMPSATQPAVYLIEELIGRESGDDNRPQRSNPNSLAYAIFTSGSTGIPKGAMVEQAGMLNHLYAKISALGLSPADIIAQTASQCFDISVWQFLAPLLVGGRVEIMNDDVVHDPARLLDQVAEHEITILEVVPSLLRAIVDEATRSNGRQKELPALRWLISTGEPLPPDLARQWVNTYPQIPLLNAYGPTECSDDVAHYRIESPPPEDVAQVPIGRPIPNMEMYILDRMMQPVPAGVPGELCVGGVGVGRGYINDPAKTAESFVPSPFAQQPGARLYKTGDLVRYLHDGNIEHRGRMDQQVKIRGFRIETGEVEAALCLHPEVREALVMARRDSAGNKHLVAYLVPDQTGLQTDEMSPSDEVAVMTAHEIVSALTPRLRIFLKERLPEYTVPAFFIGLESFPLTRNGKIDQNALARMSPPISNLEQVIVAPKTATEERLAEIWQQVLDLSRVSVRDRFLDIGGDSLRIIRAYRALSELYPDKLTVADLFKYNTIESLGTFIDETSVLKQSVAAGIQGYEL